MRVLREYFSAAILSFEFLVIIGGIVALFFPTQLQIVSSWLLDTPEIVKHFALVPSGMAVWTFTENRRLLFPGEKENRILHEWPDYWRLKVYFKVSIAYAVIFAGIGWVVWLLGLKFSEPFGFTLIITAILGSFVVVMSTYFAKIRQEEILLTIPNKE